MVTPPSFQMLVEGARFVIRRESEARYSVGDELMLREYDPRMSCYGNRVIDAVVTHILRDSPWLMAGTAALSIKLSLE